MTLLLDTSGLYAALNPAQRSHAACAQVLRSHTGLLVLSPFVLAELDYLVLTEGGVDRELALLAEVAGGAYELASVSADEVGEAQQVAARHRDLALGLADASLVVLAARYQTDEVLTLDHRHFRVVAAPGGHPFRLLPADG